MSACFSLAFCLPASWHVQSVGHTWTIWIWTQAIHLTYFFLFFIVAAPKKILYSKHPIIIYWLCVFYGCVSSVQHFPWSLSFGLVFDEFIPWEQQETDMMSELGTKCNCLSRLCVNQRTAFLHWEEIGLLWLFVLWENLSFFRMRQWGCRNSF